MARIPYAPAENPGADHMLNLFRMLAHSPPVARGFARLGGALLQDSTLDPRIREAVILRIGLLAGAWYEVEKHTAIARAIGLSDAEISALAPGQEASALDAPMRAALALTDELFADVRASDAALESARRHLDDRQLVELVVTAGYYGLVCRVLETLGIDREESS
jgi:alkylhydroperoxidase family enzyme